MTTSRIVVVPLGSLIPDDDDNVVDMAVSDDASRI
jgi:hypothetical protein